MAGPPPLPVRSKPRRGRGAEAFPYGWLLGFGVAAVLASNGFGCGRKVQLPVPVSAPDVGAPAEGTSARAVTAVRPRRPSTTSLPAAEVMPPAMEEKPAAKVEDDDVPIKGLPEPLGNPPGPGPEPRWRVRARNY